MTGDDSRGPIQLRPTAAARDDHGQPLEALQG